MGVKSVPGTVLVLDLTEIWLYSIACISGEIQKKEGLSTQASCVCVGGGFLCSLQLQEPLLTVNQKLPEYKSPESC